MPAMPAMVSNIKMFAPIFHNLMEGLPISNSTYSRWNKCDPHHLEVIAIKMLNSKVNPWVFTADARHFWQFADQYDLEFFWQMSDEDHGAIFGNWSDEDWEMGNK